MRLNLSRTVLLLILGMGIFWRFYNFENRLAFNQDQARDAILANYFWKEKIWPLLGPTSSAGPFNFGGIYYYFIMGFVLLPGVWAPWLATTGLMTLTILLAYLLGKEVLNKRLGLGLAFLVAYSPVLITISLDMLNTVMVWPFSLLALYLFIKIIKATGFRSALALGVAVGMAAAMHFQALGLLPLGVLAGWMGNRNFKGKLMAWIKFGLGFGLPFVPNIVFDLQNGGRWLQSVVNFYTVGVHKFYVPIRWLTEIRDFWPSLLGQVAGGEPRIGYIILALGAVGIMWQRKKLPKTVIAMLLFAAILVLEIRYYAGARSWEYFIFTYPLLLTLTAWVGWFVAEKILPKKILLLVVVGLVAAANIANWHMVNKKSQVGRVLEIKKQIDAYLATKPERAGLQLYQREGANMLSLPLLYWYGQEEKLSKDGESVLVAITKKGYEAAPLLGNEKGSYLIEDKVLYDWNGINYPGAKR